MLYVFIKEGFLLIWQRLSPIWRTCIEDAWEAYQHNSLPHGAVVTDAEDNIVARGRNRIREYGDAGRQIAGNRLAHAELNALIELDWRTVNIYGCKLYSVIEPCAMCIGAVLMPHMHVVHYAVRDGGAGGTTLIDKTPFFKSNEIQVTGPQDSELEAVLLGLQVEATLSQKHPNPEAWIDLLTSKLPIGKTLGYALYETGLVPQWASEGKDAGFMIDQFHEQLLRLG